MNEKVGFKSKNFADVMLNEDDISSIINGEKVYKITPKGEKVSISQCLKVGMLEPIVNRENKVVSQTEIDNIKITTSAITEQIMKLQTEDAFRLGL